MGLFQRLKREDALVHTRGVTEDDEAYVPHVFLCGALHVGRRDSAEVRKHLKGTSPPPTDQLVLSEICRLSRVGFLTQVIRCELLGNHTGYVLLPYRLRLEPLYLIQHHPHGLIRVDGGNVDSPHVCALAVQERIGSV